MPKRCKRRFSTHPKGRAKGFNVSLVDFTNAGECCAQHGVIVLVYSFFDKVWRFVLELFVSRKIVACFFCTEESRMTMGALKPAGIDSLPSHHDRNLVNETHLLHMLDTMEFLQTNAYLGEFPNRFLVLALGFVFSAKKKVARQVHQPHHTLREVSGGCKHVLVFRCVDEYTQDEVCDSEGYVECVSSC